MADQSAWAALVGAGFFEAADALEDLTQVSWTRNLLTEALPSQKTVGHE
jgi:hypothetical protein